MIKLTNVPEISYRRRVTIGGTNELGEVPQLRYWKEEEGRQDFQPADVQQTSRTSWQAQLTLTPGRWRVEAGALEGESFISKDVAALEVRASQPRLENIKTGLDERGELMGLQRDPGESLKDYQKWLLDAFRRPGGRNWRGSVSNISRQLRLEEKPALLVLTSDPTTDVRILPTSIRWSCSTFVRQESALYVQALRGVRTQFPLRRLLRVQTHSGQELKWKRRDDVIVLEQRPDGDELELVYQYWKEVSTADPSMTLDQLLLRLNDRCANAGYLVTGRTGACNKGLGRIGWPNRFMDLQAGKEYQHCANGTCSFYAAASPVRFALASDWSAAAGFVTSDELLSMKAMQLVSDGMPLALEQCGERQWLSIVTACPAVVRELSDRAVREVLSGQQFLGSPLSKIQEEMQRAFQNLWGTAAEGKPIITPAKAVRFDSISPTVRQPDQVAPELFRSGVDPVLSPRLHFEDLPGGVWQARVSPGHFWHGPVKHYLYAGKRTVSLADCAVLEIEQAAVRFEQDGKELEQGQIGYRSWKLEDSGAAAVASTNFVSAAPGVAFAMGQDGTDVSLLRLTSDKTELVATGTGTAIGIAAISQDKCLILYQRSGVKDVMLWTGQSTLDLSAAGQWSAGTLLGADVISATEAYIFGTAGNIKLWNGATFTAMNLPQALDLAGVTRDSSGRLWATTSTGRFYLRSGSAWVLHPTSCPPVTISDLHGDWAIGSLSGASWTLRLKESAAKAAVLTVDPVKVVPGTTFTLQMLGISFTFTAGASANYATGTFVDSDTASTLLTNIAAAIGNSPFGGLVSTYSDGVSKLYVSPVGGPASKDLLSSATVASAANQPVTITVSNEPLWLLDTPLRSTGQPCLVGDKLISDGVSLWQLDALNKWTGHAALSDGAVYAASGLFGVCVGGGKAWRIVPDQPVWVDGNEILPQVSVALCARDSRIVIPQSLVQTSPGLIRIALGPVMSEHPGLWTSLRWEDQLAVNAISSGDGTFVAQGLTLALRKASLKWRLPSVPEGSAPVVVTNNAIRREDAYQDRSEYFSREEFYVDGDGWIHFSRRPSLLYNPSFEIEGSPNTPAGWQFVGESGETLTASENMRRVTTSELKGCSFRGECAVLMQTGDGPLQLGGIQTETELDPARSYTLSFIARKGVLSGSSVAVSSAQVPMAIRVIPISDSGKELAWPAQQNGGFDGWSDPLPLTNLWTRYAFSFGSGARRLPEGTASVRLRLVSLGTVTGEHICLVDAVQLEEGSLATDFADRAYGFGDDLTVEYEDGAGDYIVPLEVNPALLPESPVIGLAEVNPVVTLSPNASSEILAFGDLNTVMLSSSRLSLQGSGTGVNWKSTTSQGFVECQLKGGAEGYLVSAETSFTPPARTSVTVAFAFGPAAAPWRVGLSVTASGERQWYLDMGRGGQAISQPLASGDPTGYRFRIETGGSRGVTCYLWDGSAWQKSAVFYANEGASLPKGRAALSVLSPQGSVVAIGFAAPTVFEIADGPPSQVRVDDWNPWYSQTLLQAPRVALRYDKTAHRSSVPYAVVSGASKLRWVREFQTHDNSTEMTVLEGSAPTNAASIKLEPEGTILRYREAGSKVRLTATVRSEQGFLIGGQKVRAKITRGGLGRLRATGASPAREIVANTDEHGVASLDYVLPESLEWNIVKLDGGDASYKLDDFINQMGEKPAAGALLAAGGIGAGADNSRLAVAVDDSGSPLLTGPLYKQTALPALRFAFSPDSGDVVPISVASGTLTLTLPAGFAAISLTLSGYASYGALVDAVNTALAGAGYDDLEAQAVCDRHLAIAAPWPASFSDNVTASHAVSIDGVWSTRWARWQPLSQVTPLDGTNQDKVRAPHYSWSDIVTKTALFTRTDTLDRLTCLTIKEAVLPRSLQMVVEDVAQDQVDSAQECYGRPGTIFIEYDGRQTQVYYHTAVVGASPDPFELSYLRRFVFEEDEDCLRIEPSLIGLPSGCFLRIEPDLSETVTVSLDGTGPDMSGSATVVSSVAQEWTDAEGDHPVSALQIVFDQQAGDQVFMPRPGSGDSLRVHLKWEAPDSTSGVAGFIFHWHAAGPTGVYNENPAPEDGASQAGSHQDRHLYWNGQRWVPSTGIAVPLTSQKSYDVVVKWPGVSWLDDTLSDLDPNAYNDEGQIVLSRLSDQAGGGVVWEGGGIDKALYTVTVLTVNGSGDVMGSATARAYAPDLTPPAPPEVWPDEASSQITIELTPEHDDLAARPFILSADSPTFGELYKKIAATGVVRISYESGSTEAVRGSSLRYCTGFKVGKLKRGVLSGVQNLGQGWDAYSMTREVAELLAQGQRAYVTFSAEETQNPPALALALPESSQGMRGTVTVKISHAETWIEQRATPHPEVTVRWQERNYLYRNLDTGLLQPSFNKEVKI